MFRQREDRFELLIIEFFDGDFVKLGLNGSVQINDFDVSRLNDRFENEPGFLGIDVCRGSAGEVFRVVFAGRCGVNEADIDITTVCVRGMRFNLAAASF